MILLQAFENEESAQLVMELEKIQNELVPILPMINKKKGRNKDEILAQMQMKQLLKQCREQLNDGVNDLLNTTGATAIQKLVDKRIVSIYDYSYNGFSLDELTGGFFANLLGTIKQGKSYPLFDKISADVVRSVIDNDILDFSNIDKEIIRHAGIAALIHLFVRHPPLFCSLLLITTTSFLIFVLNCNSSSLYYRFNLSSHFTSCPQ